MNSDHPESDWQVDQRFRELIRAEFGDVAGTWDLGDADPPPLAPPPVRRFRPARKLPDPIEYFNLGQEIDWAEVNNNYYANAGVNLGFNKSSSESKSHNKFGVVTTIKGKDKNWC